jgi:hypothetical protein
VFGPFEIDALYNSQYHTLENIKNLLSRLSKSKKPRPSVMYVCDRCLAPLVTAEEYTQHVAERCPMRGAAEPPGVCIYETEARDICVREVRGATMASAKNKFKSNDVRTFAFNLTLLSQLFIDHKSGETRASVSKFDYYVVYQRDTSIYGASSSSSSSSAPPGGPSGGVPFGDWHLIGYFSKSRRYQFEKRQNLSCIMVLPPHKSKGFGRMLIDFSYLLTRRQALTGGPEAPISDEGLVSYTKYWRDVVLWTLRRFTPSQPVSIRELSRRTGMAAADVVRTLHALKAVRYVGGSVDISVPVGIAVQYGAGERNPHMFSMQRLRWQPPAPEDSDESDGDGDGEENPRREAPAKIDSWPPPPPSSSQTMSDDGDRDGDGDSDSDSGGDSSDGADVSMDSDDADGDDDAPTAAAAVPTEALLPPALLSTIENFRAMQKFFATGPLAGRAGTGMSDDGDGDGDGDDEIESDSDDSDFEGGIADDDDDDEYMPTTPKRLRTRAAAPKGDPLGATAMDIER